MIRQLVIVLILAASSLLAADESVPAQRVGLPLEIREIYIPGSEVKALPRRDRKPPLMVRILEVKPAKDGFRYDFDVQGLEPGRYDLADFLEAPEGTTIPVISLEITSALAPGIVHPNKNEAGDLPVLGGYQTKMIIFGSLWLVGLIAILLWRKKKPIRDESDGDVAPSLAARLRPLIDEAAKGHLSSADRAKLERLIFGHWREKRPDIAAMPPAEAMVKLRHDDEAAPLLLALERWLHAPAGETSSADIETLLSPYSR